MPTFRKLDPDKMVDTIAQLDQRIAERFPGSGLSTVCAELMDIARRTQARADKIARPDLITRLGVGLVLVVGFVLLGYLAVSGISNFAWTNSFIDILQGIDSAFNIIVLMGASLFFMVTLEERLKRRGALKALHELRSIVHVIDMHQLTKDPGARVTVSQAETTQPSRELTHAEVVRYLDFCADMMSLTSKVGVLYAQVLPDAVVTEAVNDLERTAASLSQKIWQKIAIVQAMIQLGDPGPVATSAAVRLHPD